MSNFLLPIIIGIISGIVSTALFHCLLKFTKPNIIISDCIEKRIVDQKPVYHIKVVNLRKRNAVGIKLYLYLVHAENGHDGTILRYEQMEIHDGGIPYIDPYDKKDSTSKYAIRLELPNQLLDIWKDDRIQYLRFGIYCVDEFTGSEKFFSQEYRQHSKIIEGKFKTGKSLEIVPV